MVSAPPAVSGVAMPAHKLQINLVSPELPRSSVCTHTGPRPQECICSPVFNAEFLSASLRAEGRVGVLSSLGVVFLQWPSSLTLGTHLPLEVFKILCLIMFLVVCVCLCSLGVWL